MVFVCGRRLSYDEHDGTDFVVPIGEWALLSLDLAATLLVRSLPLRLGSAGVMRVASAGTVLVAAAPGTVVATHNDFLRGGLTGVHARDMLPMLRLVCCMRRLWSMPGLLLRSQSDPSPCTLPAVATCSCVLTVICFDDLLLRPLLPLPSCSDAGSRARRADAVHALLQGAGADRHRCAPRRARGAVG
mgnify:CR=1 FL=1